VSTGITNSTVISHYAGDSDSPAWTVDSAGKWTRDIAGIDGNLAAIQTNGGTPVLQLPNLHGDIVATAAMSETETKLLSTAETTEFGTPSVSNPSKYSWLGADQRSTELPTGVIAMGARTYIPQIGRFEQTDPQPGGGASAYSYTSGDPVNTADPSGEFTSTVTYSYEAAETGPAEENLSEHFIVAGAVMPPPVDLQIEEEFSAHPPWSAVSMLEAGGRREHRRGVLNAMASRAKGNGEEYGVPEPGICVWVDHHQSKYWVTGPRTKIYARALERCETLENSRENWKYEEGTPDKGTRPAG